MRRGIPKEPNKQICLWRNSRKQRALKTTPVWRSSLRHTVFVCGETSCAVKERLAANRDTASTGVARMRDFAHSVALAQQRNTYNAACSSPLCAGALCKRAR